MDEDIAASKAAGFADHLTKPVDLSRLKKTLATHSPPANHHPLKH